MLRTPIADFLGRDERREPSPEEACCFVRVMTTRRDGTVVCTQDVRFSSFASALREAERLQRQFDDECVAARAYVCDATGTPVRAAGGRR